jgi:hypothetical protein
MEETTIKKTPCWWEGWVPTKYVILTCIKLSWFVTISDPLTQLIFYVTFTASRLLWYGHKLLVHLAIHPVYKNFAAKKKFLTYFSYYYEFARSLAEEIFF